MTSRLSIFIERERTCNLGGWHWSVQHACGHFLMLSVVPRNPEGMLRLPGVKMQIGETSESYFHEYRAEICEVSASSSHAGSRRSAC